MSGKPRWLYRFVHQLLRMATKATPDRSPQFTLNCFVGELPTASLSFLLTLTTSLSLPFLSLDQRFVLSSATNSPLFNSLPLPLDI